jgi:hypothetical protein
MRKLRPSHCETTQGVLNPLHSLPNDPLQPGATLHHCVGHPIQFLGHIYVDVGFATRRADLRRHVLNLDGDAVTPEGDVGPALGQFRFAFTA